jgi:1-aminocyclopropane-1-carboxylate deaminase/D-cysteine desulfhydrase-like pyridoxal-dependent ACC family enzyme
MSALPKIRYDDDNKVSRHWQRSDRFYQKEGLYYFVTREGGDVGPFASKNMAKRALELYKYIVNECATTGTYASQVVTQL